MKSHYHCIAILLFGAILTLAVSLSHAQFVQQGACLQGSGASGIPCQGEGVSISADGNTAIIGGYDDNSGAGAAWIFVRSGTAWTQQGQKLVGTGAVGAAHQGYSVAISADGNTAITGGVNDNGGIGAAWIFVRNGTAWTQQGGKLVGTGAVGASSQGVSVSLSADGSGALVGGWFDNNGVGAAWSFTRWNGVWTQWGTKIVGTGAVGSAYQGRSVSLGGDGAIAIIGGPFDNNNIGAAWVFLEIAGGWKTLTKLVGTGYSGQSEEGFSVAISQDESTAIIGGSADNGGLGAFWVFTSTPDNLGWAQQGTKLVGTGAVGSASQATSLSLSANGNLAIEGAAGDNTREGAAWVFKRTGTAWAQLGGKMLGSGASGTPNEGNSVAMAPNGYTAIVGGPQCNYGSGAAWIYTYNGLGITGSPEVQPRYRLIGNYPNPFNPGTTITYELGSSVNVRLTVFDMLGRTVSTLVNEKQEPGKHEVRFDGSALSSGVYFYRIQAGDFVQTRRFSLVR